MTGSANQMTGFYLLTTLAFNELMFGLGYNKGDNIISLLLVLYFIIVNRKIVYYLVTIGLTVLISDY